MCISTFHCLGAYTFECSECKQWDVCCDATSTCIGTELTGISHIWVELRACCWGRHQYSVTVYFSIMKSVGYKFSGGRWGETHNKALSLFLLYLELHYKNTILGKNPLALDENIPQLNNRTLHGTVLFPSTKCACCSKFVYPAVFVFIYSLLYT